MSDMEPDLYTVRVQLYAPDGDSGNYVSAGSGVFDINLNEPEFTRASCADLLGRFIREQAAKHEWWDTKASNLIAGGQFPVLDVEWVYADSQGRELAKGK